MPADPAAAAAAAAPRAALPVSLLGVRFAVPGRVVLLCVPFIWASYGVSLKALYHLPWALSGPVFNCARLVFAMVLVLPSLVAQLRAREGVDMAHVARAGFELGFYTFLTNMLQMFGLRFTTASRGAFLAQLSTIMVPVAAFAAGMEPRPGWHICAAAAMAVCGVACLTLDNLSDPFSLRGDGLLLLTAAVASLYVLRCKVHADVKGPLVAVKVVAQAVFATAFLALRALPLMAGAALPSLANVFAGATPALIAINLGVVLWAGIFVSIVSSVLQMRGQKLVSASEAVVIFTLTPLWASALAIPLGERFGLRGMLGAVLILASTLLASRTPKSDLKTA